MMDDDTSYHGSITSEEAKQKLKMCGGLHYLTRFSESNQRYMLSVYQNEPKELIKHFRLLIHRDSDGRKCVQIEGKEKSFRRMEQLLQYYEDNRIDPAFECIGYLCKPEKRPNYVW